MIWRNFWPRDSSRGHRLYIVSQKTPTFSFVIQCVTVWFHHVLSQITWLNHFVTNYLTYSNCHKMLDTEFMNPMSHKSVFAILSKSIHFFIQFHKKSRGLEYESIFGLVYSVTIKSAATMRSSSNPFLFWEKSGMRKGEASEPH